MNSLYIRAVPCAEDRTLKSAQDTAKSGSARTATMRKSKPWDPNRTWPKIVCYHLAVCQNLVPLVNIKIAGKWMFIPLKVVLIGIDPYPFLTIKNCDKSDMWFFNGLVLLGTSATSVFCKNHQKGSNSGLHLEFWEVMTLFETAKTSALSAWSVGFLVLEWWTQVSQPHCPEKTHSALLRFKSNTSICVPPGLSDHSIHKSLVHLRCWWLKSTLFFHKKKHTKKHLTDFQKFASSQFSGGHLGDD